MPFVIDDAYLIYAAIALTAAGTYTSVQASKKGRRAQERAAELQKKREEEQAIRERRKVIAEARRKRAVAINAAVTQGVSPESSPIQGAEGSLNTQAASQINLSNQYESFANSIFEAKSEVVRQQERGVTGGAVAQLGSTIFANSSQISKSLSSAQAPVSAANKVQGPLTQSQDQFRTTLFQS